MNWDKLTNTITIDTQKPHIGLTRKDIPINSARSKPVGSSAKYTDIDDPLMIAAVKLRIDVQVNAYAEIGNFQGHCFC